jgi:hypothetical protein
MAMTNNFLRETDAGGLAHSSTSAPFVTSSNLYDWALYMTNASAPTAAKLVQATEKWGSTESKNETAYNLAMSTDLPFFDHMAQDPKMMKQFASYMKNVTASSATSMKHLVRGYDWASLKDATVVDVRSYNLLLKIYVHVSHIGWRLERSCKHCARHHISRAAIRCRRSPRHHHCIATQPRLPA